MAAPSEHDEPAAPAGRRGPRRPLRWLGTHPLTAVAGLTLIAGAAWLVAALAAAIGGERPPALDERLLLAMREPGDPATPIGPAWGIELARDITALGSSTVLVLVAGAVLGYLLLRRAYRPALLIIAAVGGAKILGTAFKVAVARPRPDLVPHEAVVYTKSFPSGHALAAAAVYLTLGALLARLQHSPLVKAYVLLSAMALTVAIGATRVYLGVHYPSDVVAGWAIGGGWAVLCLLVAGWLRRTGPMPHDLARHTA